MRLPPLRYSPHQPYPRPSSLIPAPVNHPPLTAVSLAPAPVLASLPPISCLYPRPTVCPLTQGAPVPTLPRLSAYCLSPANFAPRASMMPLSLNKEPVALSRRALQSTGPDGPVADGPPSPLQSLCSATGTSAMHGGCCHAWRLLPWPAAQGAACRRRGVVAHLPHPDAPGQVRQWLRELPPSGLYCFSCPYLFMVCASCPRAVPGEGRRKVVRRLPRRQAPLDRRRVPHRPLRVGGTGWCRHHVPCLAGEWKEVELG